MTRYRKRHSRPLVTTALKRRSIFRWCVSHWCFILPAIEPPKGLSSLSSRSPPLPCAISHVALRGWFSSLSFSSSLPFRPSTPSFRVLVSHLTISKPSHRFSFAIRSSVYSRHWHDKAAPYLFRVPLSIRSTVTNHFSTHNQSAHSVSI